MAYVPQSVSSEAEMAEKRVQAYTYRLQGKSLRAIGALMGVSHQTIANWVKAEATDRVDPLAEEYRQMVLDRMDIATEKLMARIEADRKDMPRAVEVLAKLEERRSKLLGLDAPERRQIEATVDTRPPELLALVEQARLQQAEKERQLREGETP